MKINRKKFFLTFIQQVFRIAASSRIYLFELWEKLVIPVAAKFDVKINPSAVSRKVKRG